MLILQLDSAYFVQSIRHKSDAMCINVKTHLNFHVSSVLKESGVKMSSLIVCCKNTNREGCEQES